MSKVEPTQRALDQAAHDEEIKRLRDERDHYRENVIPDLQAQLDQERQRRLHAEVLLREVRPMFDHIAGETGERIDKHFGEWDE